MLSHAEPPAAPVTGIPDEEVRRWREETPGCAVRVHLNNAGAALPPRPVLDTMLDHLRREAEIGGYEAEDEARERVRAVYGQMGRLLGCDPRNVALVENATVAVSQALSAFDFEPGDVLVTTRHDYSSNQVMYLALARRRGVEVRWADELPEGGVDPDSLRRLASAPRCRLVSLTWVPTNSGLVQPAEVVGEICRDAGVPYVLDACQAVGQMPVDVSRLHCDYLAGTARKFMRGPRGLGFLYVADHALAGGAYPLTVDMHGATWSGPDEFSLTPDARRFESWEIAYALVLGTGAAAEYALGVGIETARDRSWALARYARERLAALDGVRVLDRGPALCAIATAELGGRPAEAVKLALRERRINTSSPGRDDAVIDMDQKAASSALRISPHYYNTAEEIDLAVTALAEVMETIGPTPGA